MPIIRIRYTVWRFQYKKSWRAINTKLYSDKFSFVANYLSGFYLIFITCLFRINKNKGIPRPLDPQVLILMLAEMGAISLAPFFRGHTTFLRSRRTPPPSLSGR